MTYLINIGYLNELRLIQGTTMHIFKCKIKYANITRIVTNTVKRKF